jgi:diacylglycerol kinase (ATP)
LAKPLQLPVDDTRAAVKLVLGGKTRPLDLGRVNGRCFVNGVGIGLDGYAALEVRRTRRLPGMLMYLVAVARAFRTFRVTNVRVTHDGTSFERPITLVNVTNGPCHGGVFRICPHAVVDDGLLDVCVADGMSTLRLVPLAFRATRGTHVGKDGISFATTKRVTIVCDRPLPSHVDGEILGEALTRLDIDVLPAMLDVFAPG